MAITSAVGVDRQSVNSWVDGKRWLWLLSPALPFVGAASLIAVIFGAPSGLLWALPVIFYGIVPLFDWAIGADPVNAPESAVPGLDQDRYYLRIVCAYIPSQYVATFVGSWLAVNGGLDLPGLLGVLMTTGMANGVGINTAHELGHKTSPLERWLAKVTLAPVAYGHFFVEHNRGHHKNVATPEDPASARMGESFWAFLPRTMVGSLRSAWNIERERLQRKGESVWSPGNENLQAWAMTVVVFAAITVWLGWMALPFLFAQAFIGAALLEVVNYLEHYGLLRLKDSTGRVERCQPRHSWNSNHIVSNLFLYQLQRHSDHHANPTRRYQSLRHFEDSPQLPSGYAAMVLVAYLPPLWYWLMDPRVVAHHAGDLTKASVQPAARQRLLKRWAPTLKTTGTATASTPARTDVVVDAAQHQCPNCSYLYEPVSGCPQEGYPAGTRWQALPESFTCPQCAVRDKPDFISVV